MPEITEAVKRHIARLCSLLKVDDEMLKFEMECSMEAAFLEGYAAASKTNQSEIKQNS